MNMGTIRALVLVAVAAALSACGSADKPAENSTPAPAAADNTAVNERDQSGATATPPDQVESKADLEISAKIRASVVDDKSLSTNAHNIKIITSGGVVTLRGPVGSQKEKSAIETKATQVAGVTRVDNMIEIAPSN